MKTKICNKCKEEKLITKFYKDERNKNGLQSYCKICVGEYNRKWEINNPIKTWCQRTINNHKSKGHKILINIKNLLPIAKQTKDCSICGIKLDWKIGKVKPKFNSPTLDRIKNEKILTLNNIQIICWRCNTAKGQGTMNEFINYCKMVANKYDN